LVGIAVKARTSLFERHIPDVLGVMNEMFGKAIEAERDGDGASNNTANGSASTNKRDNKHKEDTKNGSDNTATTSTTATANKNDDDTKSEWQTLYVALISLEKLYAILPVLVEKQYRALQVSE